MSYKGKYSIKNPSKYVGNSSSIIFRSLWEKKFMEVCDMTPSILKWASEEVVIPYFFPVDKKWHRYFPDFYIMYKTRTNTIEESIIEIKPYKELFRPERKTKKTKRFLQENITWVKNQSKWKSAKQYCHKKGWKFQILTEKELFKKWHTER